MSEMKETKLLSIVIPAYNMEDYLERNVGNLIKAKDVEKIEIIIVNDGSTDSTLGIAKRFQAKMPDSVRVIDKPNGHYGSCLNAAIKSATGKYFRILDADDWFETDCLDKFIEKLSNCDSDLVVTFRVEQHFDKKGKLNPVYIPIDGVEYGKEYDAKTFSIKDHSNDLEFNMHSMTYKTGILRASGIVLPEKVCYTDLLYCLIPLRLVNTIVVYDIYLYNYLVGREGNSTNAKALKANLRHISVVLQAMMRFLDGQNVSDLTPALESNQRRYLEEAIGLFVSSVRMQGYVSKKTYADCIYPIIDYCKKHKVEHRLWEKHYNRFWYKHNTCFSLNCCLLYYNITHPTK